MRWVTLVLMAAVVYLPLAGIGALVWRYIYAPFLDAVDRGDAWAMTLLVLFAGALVIVLWQECHQQPDAVSDKRDYP